MHLKEFIDQMASLTKLFIKHLILENSIKFEIFQIVNPSKLKLKHSYQLNLNIIYIFYE